MPLYPPTAGPGGHKNLVHNGAMTIAQRDPTRSIGNTGVAMNSASGGVFLIDRWSVGGTSGGWTYTQDSTTPPPGYAYSAKFTVSGSTVASPVPAASYWLINQNIEGVDALQLAYGTSAPKTVTLSFWVRVTGYGNGATLGGALRAYNGGSFRSFPFSYVATTAGVWQQVTVVIPGDTVASIVSDTTGQLTVIFAASAGSSYIGTANVWQTGNAVSPIAANLMNTAGAAMAITGVQLEVNTTATPFEFRDYASELLLCQRYFATIGGGTSSAPLLGNGMATTATNAYFIVPAPVPLRAVPTSLTNSGSFAVTDRLANYTASAVILNPTSPSTTTGMLDIQATSSGLTARQPYMLYGASTGAWIGASADI
jgi:hypothetical protein